MSHFLQIPYHSSSSSEQGGDSDEEVEVVFGSAKNYRRKGSIVPPDEFTTIQTEETNTSGDTGSDFVNGGGATTPLRSRTDCIVHHFLNSQKLERPRSLPHSRSESLTSLSDSSTLPAPVSVTTGHYDSLSSSVASMNLVTSSDAQPTRMHVTTAAAPRLSNSTTASSTSSRPRMTPRTKSRIDIIDEEINFGHQNVGQIDEKAWTGAMTRPVPVEHFDGYQHRQPFYEASPPNTSASSTFSSYQPQPQQQVQNQTHSRHLTKKELSDMAWGVRELSRRLGTLRIKACVRNIFLLTKINDREVVTKARELMKWLLDPEREVRYNVFIEDKLRNSKPFNVAGLLRDVRDRYIEIGELKPKEAGEVDSESNEGDIPLDLLNRVRRWDEQLCRTRPHMFDFCVIMGGDGTVLYASWLFQRIVPPVISFALGSLGFLTKFDFDQFRPTLNQAFSKGFIVSLRLRFECTVMRSNFRRKHEEQRALAAAERAMDEAPNGDHKNQPKYEEDGEEDILDFEDELPPRDLVEEIVGEETHDEPTHTPEGTYEILNECVVDRGPNSGMSYTELFGDDEHFTSILADGVCVSTPTGSTAYNLAAGGSLCHPENPVMLVTSICAHTLSFRPLILPDTIVLRIGVPYDARSSSWASFDGRSRVELLPGDYVTISASRYPFASVQMEGRRSEDWVNSIRHKLGWNTRQKQKAWDKRGGIPEA